MSQTTCGYPKAYRTGGNRGQDKTYVIIASSSAYKGGACPRPVTVTNAVYHTFHFPGAFTLPSARLTGLKGHNALCLNLEAQSTIDYLGEIISNSHTSGDR